MRRPSRQRSLHALLALILLVYLVLLFLELPFTSRRPRVAGGDAVPSHIHSSKADTVRTSAPARPHRLLATSAHLRSPILSGLVFDNHNATTLGSFSVLHASAARAWALGRELFDELLQSPPSPSPPQPNMTDELCPSSITLTGENLTARGRLMVLPCGLAVGSHITLVGRPLPAHPDHSQKIRHLKDGKASVMVSQFMLELQSLNSVDGEVPPKTFYFNPRLKGDWCGRPVIEQNTCYRMAWGTPIRCEGLVSNVDKGTVDGLVKCEKWISDENDNDDDQLNRLKKKSLLNGSVGNSKKKPSRSSSSYPFEEGKLFVLTLRAGLEGYHVTVDGKHISSFPYHPGFVLEDSTGLAFNGDLDVESILAASLPTSHSSYATQRSLQMLPQLKAPELPHGPVEIFIGILSAGNHFAERMAVRKTWMSSMRKSSNVVARFFVALHGRKEVNIELKREAEFFGDIVIVPYMDSYDLVVLKTVAICEFGVHNVSAKYIMKCDDDTFVRPDALVLELSKLSSNSSIYLGNMNMYNKPLRAGKWAVTYEEWPGEEYPPYANGPGYIISYDIARFVVSEFEKHTLKLFKMEDVSMGLWVGQYKESMPVDYFHSLRFCQYGCIDGYLIAHYQSPRQMMCLWDKLRAGKPGCCNVG